MGVDREEFAHHPPLEELEVEEVILEVEGKRSLGYATAGNDNFSGKIKRKAWTERKRLSAQEEDTKDEEEEEGEEDEE